MRLTWLFTVLAATALSADDNVEAPWARLFDRIARDYRLIRPSDSGEPTQLELVEGAAYQWGRPQQQGDTFGKIYIWTHHGNAEAVACIWRYVGPDGSRSIVHELHSLSPDMIHSEQPFDTWKPQAGLKRAPLPETGGQPFPAPSANAAVRLQQMRSICRDFQLHTVADSGNRTELRLLPQPLYRSESTDPEILDAAVFAYVCSVGTDPEANLQLTAVQAEDGPQWRWTLARFTHHNLYASFDDREIWSAIRDAENPISHNADRTYEMFHQSFKPSMLEGPAAHEN